MTARRLPCRMQEVILYRAALPAEETRELTDMRRQDRHLREITQRVEMPPERVDRIRIHHERCLHLCRKETDKLARLRCAPDPRAASAAASCSACMPPKHPFPSSGIGTTITSVIFAASTG